MIKSYFKCYLFFSWNAFKYLFNDCNFNIFDFIFCRSWKDKNCQNQAPGAITSIALRGDGHQVF